MKNNFKEKGMLVRFCDENAGALSFAFANGEELVSNKSFVC